MMPLYVEVGFTLCVAAYLAFVWYTFFGEPILFELCAACAFLAFFAVVKLYTNVIIFRLNVTAKTYQKIYGLGFIKFRGRWKPLPPVEYVSVFCQMVGGHDDDGGSNYDVNLWHEGNKHVTIYSDYLAEPAFRLGRTIAKKLEVDLLDATAEDPDDYTWIELQEK